MYSISKLPNNACTQTGEHRANSRFEVVVSEDVAPAKAMDSARRLVKLTLYRHKIIIYKFKYIALTQKVI
jgi:hypothetical protein